MKKLLNSLYITQPDAYLSLDGENVVISIAQERVGRIPLHNIQSIVTFGYTGVSPALLGHCAEKNISIVFMKKSGRFLARVTGESRGNVVLRKKQYKISSEESQSALLARNFILGKIFNQKWVIERAKRDYEWRLDTEKLKLVSIELSKILGQVKSCDDLESLRGFEGQAAIKYNSVFDELILQQKDSFYFHGRSRRPPLDRVNALLSFSYTLLANDVAAALETVGLDSYVGFLHRDRPGRASLALDVMEELRPVIADRFVLTLINKKEIQAADFIIKENQAVLLTDEGRKKFLQSWQQKKQEKLTHPYLGEKIEWGLVSHVQSLLLARTLREDLDQYPPFLWK